MTNYFCDYLCLCVSCVPLTACQANPTPAQIHWRIITRSRAMVAMCASCVLSLFSTIFSPIYAIVCASLAPRPLPSSVTWGMLKSGVDLVQISWHGRNQCWELGNEASLQYSHNIEKRKQLCSGACKQAILAIRNMVRQLGNVWWCLTVCAIYSFLLHRTWVLNGSMAICKEHSRAWCVSTSASPPGVEVGLGFVLGWCYNPYYCELHSANIWIGIKLMQ